jgi:hypothetical protein
VTLDEHRLKDWNVREIAILARRSMGEARQHVGQDFTKGSHSAPCRISEFAAACGKWYCIRKPKNA